MLTSPCTINTVIKEELCDFPQEIAGDWGCVIKVWNPFPQRCSNARSVTSSGATEKMNEILKKKSRGVKYTDSEDSKKQSFQKQTFWKLS